MIEELFPGILDELVLDGAHYFDGRDLSQLYYNLGGHPMVRSGSAASFTAYLVTRPFLEDHVRARVRNIPSVTLLDEHDVVALTATRDHHRITGARVVNRRTCEDAALDADLVVDATGRAARTPSGWTAWGTAARPRMHVAVHVTYVSQCLGVAPDALHEFGFVVGRCGAGRADWACCTRERHLAAHRVRHSGPRRPGIAGSRCASSSRTARHRPTWSPQS